MGTVKLDVFPGIGVGFGGDAGDRLVVDVEAVEGETVRALLGRLAQRVDGFGDAVFDTETQALRQHVSLVYNGRLIELVAGLDTPLNDGDVLTILPAFSGG